MMRKRHQRGDLEARVLAVDPRRRASAEARAASEKNSRQGTWEVSGSPTQARLLAARARQEEKGMRCKAARRLRQKALTRIRGV